MTTATGFLAAVIADPDNDSPRLFFADWLEEHGEPERAEFIRVQCELVVREARRDSRGNGIGLRDRKWEPLHRREQELLAEHEDRWLPSPFFDPSGLLRPDGSNPYSWHRGFIEAITLSAEAWLEHADALTAAAPIRLVTLMTWPPLESIATGVPRRDEYSAQFAGRPGMHTFSIDQGQPSMRFVLEAEWPRIKFTLPTRVPRRKGLPDTHIP